MSLVQLNKRTPQTGKFALLNLGFRPFFLGAALLAIISIALWLPVYFSYIILPMGALSSFQWHSHEMIYGYAMAVIAGFLLTAIRNWTSVQTIHGKSLLALFSLWLVARVLFLFGTRFLGIAALADMAFMIGLFAAVAAPIVKAKQWRQLGVLSKVVFLFFGNLVFYLGAFGLLENGARWGIYGGLYIVIALILVISGRVFPVFIRNGVDYDVVISNPRWITAVNLILFVLFFVNQLFIQDQTALGCLATSLFAVNTLRLKLWYTHGIWRKPLLWSLYFSLIFIDIGFLLLALTVYLPVSPFLAIHAFAFGGIGIITLGMMSRVSLGHTGRSIGAPPIFTTLSLSLLAIGGVFRIGFPLVDMTHYAYWIFTAQILWIVAFALFLISYTRILFLPRVDGQPG